jgi:hypothetical protein
MLKYTTTVLYPRSFTNRCRDLLLLVFYLYSSVFLYSIDSYMRVAIHLHLLVHNV